MNFKNYLQSNQPVALSPMDGITDEPYRLLQCRISKPDVLFTEFVSAEGISHGGVKLYDHLLYLPEERPIIGQLFGKDPDSFYKSSVILCHLGFDGIDINMGCPAPTVIDNGSGAALIGTPDLAIQIIQSAHKAIQDYKNNKVTINDLALNQKTLKIIERNVSYSRIQNLESKIYDPTLSVKTRLGIREPSVDQWFSVLLTQPLDFITLHGRTLRQGYSGLADWDFIAQAANLTHQTKIKFWGNGDLQNQSQAKEYIQKYNLDGALIGRASMGNPWAFSDTQATARQRFDTMLLHAQMSLEIFPDRRFDPLRKHFLLYASGLPNAKDLRSKLVRINNLAQLQAIESDFVL